MDVIKNTLGAGTHLSCDEIGSFVTTYLYPNQCWSFAFQRGASGLPEVFQEQLPLQFCGNSSDNFPCRIFFFFSSHKSSQIHVGFLQLVIESLQEGPEWCIGNQEYVQGLEGLQVVLLVPLSVFGPSRETLYISLWNSLQWITETCLGRQTTSQSYRIP